MACYRVWRWWKWKGSHGDWSQRIPRMVSDVALSSASLSIDSIWLSNPFWSMLAYSHVDLTMIWQWVKLDMSTSLVLTHTIPPFMFSSTCKRFHHVLSIEIPTAIWAIKVIVVWPLFFARSAFRLGNSWHPNWHPSIHHFKWSTFALQNLTSGDSMCGNLWGAAKSFHRGYESRGSSNLSWLLDMTIMP